MSPSQAVVTPESGWGFLAYVESQPAGTPDHHWDDQYRVLLMDHIDYERWFRMEGEFTTGLQQTFERIGLTGPVMERILATQKNTSPKNEAPVYTPQIAARVHRLYARDFATFGGRRIQARALRETTQVSWTAA